ncbi:MAG: fused MFS/spermidine synthase [Pirellulaceae bacterium]|nr:fused MFS/spermidine synthase [Pirellulaceae bacterium]
MKHRDKPRHAPTEVSSSKRNWTWRQAAFLLTTFVGSFLLFQIQPLIGKLILPWFGGTASVWTMCLLFFQTVLFAGYLYAHLTSVYLKPRVQVVMHCMVVVAAIGTLPILPSDTWRATATVDPSFGVLQVLAFSVGLPYFLLATNAPLVQRWWAMVVGASAYQLYSLSNAGSLLALLTYTLIAERLLGTRMISFVWTVLFVFLGVLLFRCLLWVWQTPQTKASPAVPLADNTRHQRQWTTGSQEVAVTVAGPTWTRRAIWLFLAATGTTVLMSMTTYLCQDIASVPIMWLAPLTLYLLSFILCFGASNWYRRLWFMPILTILSFVAAMIYGQLFSSVPTSFLLTINLLALFCAFMVVHGELERSKPAVEHLTQYFLYISGGGMLGGFYVGLVAPLLYPDYYELPLVMIVIGLIPIAILHLEAQSPLHRGRRAWAWAIIVAIFGCHGLVWSYGYLQRYQMVWSTGRNFYGVLKVAVRPLSTTPPLLYVSLMNGHITHGGQLAKISVEGDLSNIEMLPTPTTYYGETSGIGRVFRATQGGRPRRIAAVGLGVGTLGAYAQKNDQFRFYEINHKVVELAEDPFTYLAEIKKSQAEYEVVMGDARLSLESETPQNFDIIAVDAFSGDSIPVHLITREAADVYLRHLASDGILAFHISNRYVDLTGVLYDIAIHNRLELAYHLDTADVSLQQYMSEWVLIRRPSKQQNIPELQFYPTSMLNGKQIVWTDDRSSLLEAMK